MYSAMPHKKLLVQKKIYHAGTEKIHMGGLKCHQALSGKSNPFKTPAYIGVQFVGCIPVIMCPFSPTSPILNECP